MPSLKEVRNRINSVRSTQQITKAMKMVAAAKLRKAQDNILQMRPYSERLQGILSNLIANTEEQAVNPFAEERPIQNVLVVVVTSDRGLCGGFNANIVKAVNSLVENKYSEQQRKGQVTYLCVGRKGRDAFKRRNAKINEEFTEIFHGLSFAKVRQAAEFVMQGFVDKHFDVVEVVYNEFKNVATQIVRTSQFLPLAAAPTQAKQQVANNTDYLYEPNRAEIMADLLPKSLKIQFYKAVLESNASEQGARMTAMDKATENAGELLKELRLTYNRTRQAAITKEILEIVGGAEALSNG
ncbi:MAG: ATP synthase F1 subunit gamma [Bernardetiaceae bacterium]|jgi:F-type H+-transporting ATPase subunit gamma|nr:ATP synthase F1 subunit gamma [Bernardetiaceae bacterium]